MNFFADADYIESSKESIVPPALVDSVSTHLMFGEVPMTNDVLPRLRKRRIPSTKRIVPSREQSGVIQTGPADHKRPEDVPLPASPNFASVVDGETLELALTFLPLLEQSSIPVAVCPAGVPLPPSPSLLPMEVTYTQVKKNTISHDALAPEAIPLPPSPVLAAEDRIIKDKSTSIELTHLHTPLSPSSTLIDSSILPDEFVETAATADDVVPDPATATTDDNDAPSSSSSPQSSPQTAWMDLDEDDGPGPLPCFAEDPPSSDHILAATSQTSNLEDAPLSNLPPSSPTAEENDNEVCSDLSSIAEELAWGPPCLSLGVVISTMETIVEEEEDGELAFEAVFAPHDSD